MSPVGWFGILSRAALLWREWFLLYGRGTNMGLKRMAGVDPRITAEDLRYTRRRYLHKEHLRAAIAQVVNALLHARLEAIWGETTSTCASDSKKFQAVDQNLLTQWHVERRSVCIYSQLKSCTSRRAWRPCWKESYATVRI